MKKNDTDKRQSVYNKDISGIEKSIMLRQIELDSITTELKELKKIQGIINLIEELGYEEYNISDYVSKDMDSYMSFIGTESEYIRIFYGRKTYNRN